MDHSCTGGTCIEAESGARASTHSAEESFESCASLQVLAAAEGAHVVAEIPFLTEAHHITLSDHKRLMEMLHNHNDQLCTTRSSNVLLLCILGY